MVGLWIFILILLPLAAKQFHQDKIISFAYDATTHGKATFTETLLSPFIRFQCLQMDSYGINLVKDVLYKRNHRIGTIALVPVTAVTYHDAYFGFALCPINAVAGAVTDVPAIAGFYGKLAF